MKCPQCVTNNETSRCFSAQAAVNTVAMTWSEYWDEDGIFHRHDPNWLIRSYHCSRGHCWTVKARHPCPACKFGHTEPQTRIVNPV